MNIHAVASNTIDDSHILPAATSLLFCSKKYFKVATYAIRPGMRKTPEMTKMIRDDNMFGVVNSYKIQCVYTARILVVKGFYVEVTRCDMFPPNRILGHINLI